MPGSSSRVVLVTGGRGLIGRHLVRELEHVGRVDEWHDDVRAIAEYRGSSDSVIHLAGRVGSARSDAEIRACFETNVDGTLAVLAYCKAVGAQCILASTCGVFEPTADGDLISEMGSVHPANYYSISKWVAEEACRQTNLAGEVHCTVLRFFNVYGPGQKPSFLIPAVIGHMKSGTPLQLNNPGAIRDFVYVADAVDALLRAEKTNFSGDFRVLNIGSGQAHSMNEVVDVCQAVFGRTLSVTHGRGGTTDRNSVVADNACAEEVLGWRPIYDLMRGLSAYRQKLEAVPHG